MSRVALRKHDEYIEPKVDSMDWWGDFDINVPPQRPKFKVYENPKYANLPQHRPVQKKKTSNSIMAFAAVVLFFTLSILQISRIAAFTEKGKEIATLKSEITALEKDNETKELRLAMQQNIDRVRDVATRELGMVVPTEAQTIVMNDHSGELLANEETAEDSSEEMEAYGAP